MSSATSLLPRLCRTCGKSSRETVFPAMSKHLCTVCKDGARTARAGRIEARGPRVAEAVREDDGRCNEKHIRWIKRLPCAVRGHDCQGPVTAHHVRRNTDGGTGLKPSDKWTVPLCDGLHGAVEGHHQEGDRIGWLSFEAQYGVDLRALAIKLAAASPHLKGTN